MFNSIMNWFWGLIYTITKGIAWLVQIMYNCFEIAAGLDTVSYDGNKTTLLEVVFGHGLINRAYWSMAIIGVGLCFFFTILAVIRKMFDSSNKVRSSLGEILTQCFKSILLICSMSLLMNLALYFSTSLMEAVQIAFFSNGTTATEENPKTFTESEYAEMARVLNTIGNYSLNPSRNSRYNINSCYNDIRGELSVLETAGTFNVQYETPDLLNNKEHYWQETLQKIVNAAPDLEQDVPLDVYNAGLSEAIENAMDEILMDESFKPLKQYAQNKADGDSSRIEMDRVILVLGTFDAAKNDKYNGSAASLTDNLRRPYYYNEGVHDVYSLSQMKKDFDLSEYSFFMTIFLCIVLAKNMVVIILDCIARIFNMALLYLTSPLFIATSPLDDGGKFKQWGIAFIGQCFGVFGTVVAMDLLVMFSPIIMSDSLQISSNSFADTVIKVIILWAIFETSKKASGMVTAILGDNGAAAAGAGDMTREARMVTGTLGRMFTRSGKPKKGQEQEKGKGKEKEAGSKLVETPAQKAGGGGKDDGGGDKDASADSTAPSKAEGGSKDAAGGSAPSKAGGGGKDAAGGADKGASDGAEPSKQSEGDKDSGASDGAAKDGSGGAEPSKQSEGDKDKGASDGAAQDGSGSADVSKQSEGDKDSGVSDKNASSADNIDKIGKNLEKELDHMMGASNEAGAKNERQAKTPPVRRQSPSSAGVHKMPGKRVKHHPLENPAPPKARP